MSDIKSEMIKEIDLEILDKLFDKDKRVAINTDEDLIALGDIFNEEDKEEE